MQNVDQLSNRSSLYSYSNYRYHFNLHALLKEKIYFRIVLAVIKGLNNSTARLDAKISKQQVDVKEAIERVNEPKVVVADGKIIPKMQYEAQVGHAVNKPAAYATDFKNV